MSESACIVEGCERPRRKSYRKCGMHVYTWKRYGDHREVKSQPRVEGPGCVVEGCDRKRHGEHRYCAAHERRKEVHGDLFTDVPVLSQSAATQRADLWTTRRQQQSDSSPIPRGYAPNPLGTQVQLEGRLPITHYSDSEG
jgi:hypothetical protein